MLSKAQRAAKAKYDLAYRIAHLEQRAAYSLAWRKANLRPNENDILEAAKRRVAADPMRHWVSPPCS